MQNCDTTQVDEDRGERGRFYISSGAISNWSERSSSPWVLMMTLIARCRCCRVSAVSALVSPDMPLLTDKYCIVCNRIRC